MGPSYPSQDLTLFYRQAKIYLGFAVFVSVILTLSVWAGVDWWHTLWLTCIWAASLFLGLREFRRVSDQDRRELEAWVTVGGDLFLTTLIPSEEGISPRILSVGPGFTRVLGWQTTELIGEPWVDFVHPDDQGVSVQEADRLAKGKPVQQFVNRWRHKNPLASGEPRWIWLEWNAVYDPRLGKIFANARDMTERFEREVQMATWSRITSDLMAVCDTTEELRERKVLWVNDAWSRKTGYTLPEIYTLRITDLLDPQEVTEERFGDFGLALLMVPRFECRVFSKPDSNGKRTELLYEWSCLILNGKLYMTGRDVGNERALIYEKIRSLESLEARNRDLERFASVAAHQLRSPPRTIAGIAQALKEDYGDRLDEHGREFLNDIFTDASQMADIVEGLYRFSKVTTSDDLKVAPVDINAILQEIHDSKMKRGCFAGGNRQLTWEPLPVVLGDRVLLHEALTNLIDNGFKFNESEIKRVHLSYSEGSKNNFWAIHVRDNGIGIDPRYQPKLFSMFQRVHTNYSGTGVGLALVAAIIQKLGGVISVESQPDVGSIFTFQLPESTP